MFFSVPSSAEVTFIITRTLALALLHDFAVTAPWMQCRGENSRSCVVNTDENVPYGKQFSELPAILIFRQAGKVYSLLL